MGSKEYLRWLIKKNFCSGFKYFLLSSTAYAYQRLLLIFKPSNLTVCLSHEMICKFVASSMACLTCSPVVDCGSA